MLKVDNISLYYGAAQALRGVTVAAEPGKVTCVLGRNGVGKTSLLRALVGQQAISSGSITFDGQDISALKPYERARRGISFVPQGREIFPLLTVEENLDVSFIRQRARGSMAQSRERVYALFPRLRERHRQIAATMSGGEQQMLAIGRAMMNTPSLLMLDEPSLGLSPLMTQLVFEQLVEIQKDGTSILLVEQNASCLEIATRGLLLGNGQTLLSGDYTRLRDSDFVRRAYLGL